MPDMLKELIIYAYEKIDDINRENELRYTNPDFIHVDTYYKYEIPSLQIKFTIYNKNIATSITIDAETFVFIKDFKDLTYLVDNSIEKLLKFEERK